MPLGLAMRVIRSIFLCALALTSAFAPAQDTTNFKFEYELAPSTSYETLEDLSTSLLKDAYVLSEIGIRKSQVVRLDIRRMMSSVLALTSVQQANEAEDAKDERVIAAKKALENQQNSTFLKYTDLTAAQKAAVKRIALRDYQMHALLTKELVFALKLSDQQVQRLKTIRQEYWSRSSQLEKKHADTTKVLSIMKEYQGQNMEELSATERLAIISKLCDAMEESWVNTAAKMEAPLATATQESNARAMRVLTSSQLRQYGQLSK